MRGIPELPREGWLSIASPQADLPERLMASLPNELGRHRVIREPMRGRACRSRPDRVASASASSCFSVGQGVGENDAALSTRGILKRSISEGKRERPARGRREVCRAK